MELSAQPDGERKEEDEREEGKLQKKKKGVERRKAQLTSTELQSASSPVGAKLDLQVLQTAVFVRFLQKKNVFFKLQPVK